MAQDMLPASEPRFELTSFFNGRTTAVGVFEDRFGRLKRRLEVRMHGQWIGSDFRLDEYFIYDTGETENRTWLITPGRDGSFTATCPDCVGKAEGRCDADSIRMHYAFRLKLTDSEIVVTFDDRIYRFGDGIAVNRATMRKWGVRLGELALFFRRETT